MDGRSTPFTPGDASPRESWDFILVLVFLCSYHWGPGVVGTFTGTKYAATSGTIPAQVATASLYLLLISIAILLVRHASRIGQVRVTSALPLLLLGAASLTQSVAVGFMFGALMSSVFLALTLGVLAAAPSFRLLAILGWITAAMAGLSVIAGFIAPDMALRRFSGRVYIGAEKELIPGAGLLQGVFFSENNMGVALALGLPFVFLIRPMWARLLALGAIAWALVWSSSRGAIATAVVVLLVMFLARRGRSGARFVIAAFVVTASALVVLPLLPLSGDAFSGRAQIWSRTLSDADPIAFVLGRGPEWFSVASLESRTFVGEAAVQGHNQLVHSVAIGGLVTVGLLFAALVSALSRIVKLSKPDMAVGSAWLIGLVMAGILEVPFGVADRTHFWPVALIPLLVILGQRTADHVVSVPLSGVGTASHPRAKPLHERALHPEDSWISSASRSRLRQA